MTDDQELVAEAVERAWNEHVAGRLSVGSLLMPKSPHDAAREAVEVIAPAIWATAAVRYRAEGWDEGEAAGRRNQRRETHNWSGTESNPHRALLDENNETQEDR